MDKSKPNYFAVIPAEVRYANIPPQAKLLYGELTALSNKEGYSWSTNRYFADLYDLSIDSISRLLGILEENGFITQQYKYDSKLRANRKIYVKIHIGKNAYRQKCQDTIGKNAEGGIGKNAKDNNTSNNNTREYKERKKEETYNDVIDRLVSDKELNKAYKEWVKSRLLNKNKLTNYAVELAIKKVSKFPIEKQLPSIEESISNGWKGIFEIKDNRAKEKTYDEMTQLEKQAYNIKKMEKEWKNKNDSESNNRIIKID